MGLVEWGSSIEPRSSSEHGGIVFIGHVRNRRR